MNDQATIDVGTIFTSQWGYEQTNVCFYRVVRKTAKTVTLEKLSAVITEEGNMRGKVVPGETVTRVKQFRRSLHGDRVSICSFEHARIWDGTPQNFTAYA
jgi:hypothetical protein